MKDHVTSLELSKKLKKLGVKQESQFYWQEADAGGYAPNVMEVVSRADTERYVEGPLDFNVIASAYLATELLEILPEKIQDDEDNIYDFIIQKRGDIYRIGYGNCFYSLYETWFIPYIEDSLPNALAKMLIYLKENKLI